MCNKFPNIVFKQLPSLVALYSKMNTTACDKLRGEPWQKLRKMVEWHVRKIDYARWDYFRKTLASDMWLKSVLFSEIKMGQEPTESKLNALLLALEKNHLHRSMQEFVNEVEAREKKLKAAATEMLAFIQADALQQKDCSQERDWNADPKLLSYGYRSRENSFEEFECDEESDISTSSGEDYI